jgi:hypothetical protein
MIDVEYADSTLMAHPLFGYAHDLIVLVIESDSFHSGRKFPFEKTFACLYRPQP